MSQMGFELKINNKTYFIKCDTSIIINTSERNTSNKVNLRLRVFEDGKFIKLDRDSYVAEKITDFIRNCINGQDTIYWDWNEPNRHLEQPKSYLKWEDLEFKEEKQTVKVLLNGSHYLLEYYAVSEEEFVFIKATRTTIFNLLGKCSDDKQLFNDLHLERVEE